ncbi:MAG: hypothetical protein FWC10_09715 [Lentimicrobiaceae bacterium]|nr:hypothetical protein [Lentimicrobiaceae bacterium]
MSEANSLFTCTCCNTTHAKERLLKANERNVKKQMHNIIEKQVLPDVKSSLKNAFRGSPYIKIK